MLIYFFLIFVSTTVYGLQLFRIENLIVQKYYDSRYKRYPELGVGHPWWDKDWTIVAELEEYISPHRMPRGIRRDKSKSLGMYPTDRQTQMFVEEFCDIAAGYVRAVPYHSIPEQKKKLREAFAAEDMKIFYNFLAKVLSSNPSGFVAGDTLTVADISLYNIINFVRSGRMDYIPADYDSAWPQFEAFCNKYEAAHSAKWPTFRDMTDSAVL